MFILKKIDNEQDNSGHSYQELAQLYDRNLNENTEPFACDICMDDAIEPKQGVVLKECMHMFCKYNLYITDLSLVFSDKNSIFLFFKQFKTKSDLLSIINFLY